MLKDCKKEDFQEIKYIVIDRLSPDGIPIFFWGAFAYSGVMTLLLALGLKYGENVSSIILPMPILVKIMVFTLIVQFLVAVIFSFMKICFSFQKIQLLLLDIISLKLSWELYLFYLWICREWNQPQYMEIIAFWLFVGGIVYLFMSIMRGIRRVGKGAFREGGTGIYNFKQSKTHISLPIIFGFTMLTGSVVRILGENGGDLGKIAILYLFLFFSAAIQYIFAFAWPEFFLATYCKFRFESFQIPKPKRPLPTRKSSKQLKSKRHKANSQINVNKKKHKGGKAVGKK
ncbi:hypothetical protein ACFO4N_11825 [Camelliibacillus cellulosilyticus]|uniref:Uncharacterized protein n=1 Tax=Camelliibacillus cellulosilyticus TaxID=2174486 RepID=A0ABV9GMC0_9BACL